MCQKANAKDGNKSSAKLPLSFFACPNGECADFNRFGADNLSVAEWMGKDKAIRRLYCKTCGARFSERQGSLMEYTKLSEADVVQIVKDYGAWLQSSEVPKLLIAAKPGAILNGDQLEFARALSCTLEGRTDKQKNPHPEGSLAWLAWITARLGGWSGYQRYGPAGPKTMAYGWERFKNMSQGWRLSKNV